MPSIVVNIAHAGGPLPNSQWTINIGSASYSSVPSSSAPFTLYIGREFNPFGAPKDQLVLLDNELNLINPNSGTSPIVNPGDCVDLQTDMTGATYNPVNNKFTTSPTFNLGNNFIDGSVSNRGRLVVSVSGTLSFDEETNCCLHADTLVKTVAGNKKISQIRKGNQIIDLHGNPLKVNFNIKCKKTYRFIKLPKHSLGRAQPSMDTYIVKGHPIQINGQETQPNDLLGHNGIKTVSSKKWSHVYTLCTDERTFFKANGLLVCSYAEKEWMETRNDYVSHEKL